MFKTGWLLQKWEVRPSLSTAQRALLVLELPKLKVGSVLPLDAGSTLASAYGDCIDAYGDCMKVA